MVGNYGYYTSTRTFPSLTGRIRLAGSTMEWCIRTLQRIVSSLMALTVERELDVDLLDSHQVQLELVYRQLVAEVLGEISNSAVVDFVREAMRLLMEVSERTITIQRQYQPPLVYSGMRGRPRLDISNSQIAWLLEVRFTVPQIADILGVSVCTVRRRMSDCNMSVHELILYSI